MRQKIGGHLGMADCLRWFHRTALVAVGISFGEGSAWSGLVASTISLYSASHFAVSGKSR